MNLTAGTSRRDTVTHLIREQASLGSFTTYLQAQAVVDYLADHDFEVDTTQIIGTDLRMVEQITGRLTWPRAIASGAAGGAWFGVFVGVLVSILSATTYLRAMSFGISWGILFGVAFTTVGYAVTAGRRDFTSRSATIPSRYEVMVVATHSERAHALLAGMTR